MTAPWVTHWHLELQALSTLQGMWEKIRGGWILSPRILTDASPSPSTQGKTGFSLGSWWGKERLELEVKALDWSSQFIGFMILHGSSNSYFLICNLGEILTGKLDEMIFVKELEKPLLPPTNL